MKTNKWSILLLSLGVLFLLAASVGPRSVTANTQATTVATMAPATVPAALQQWTDAFNAHNADKIVAMFTKDGVHEDVATGTLVKGPTQIKAFLQGLFTAVPDGHIDLVNGWVQAGHGVMEWVFSGTDAGLLKTGKKFSSRGITSLDMDGTLFTRTVDYYDLATIMRQVGLLPG